LDEAFRQLTATSTPVSDQPDQTPPGAGA